MGSVWGEGGVVPCWQGSVPTFNPAVLVVTARGKDGLVTARGKDGLPGCTESSVALPAILLRAMKRIF